MRLFPTLFLAAALIAPALSSSVQAAPAAPTYTSKSDGYAVYLPGKPQVSSRTTALPNGASIKVNFVSVSRPPLTFLVIPLRLPSAPNSKQAAEFLTGVERGFTMSTQAKLISSKKIALGSSPGREILVKVGTNLMKARFYVAGKKSYQIIAISPQNGGAKYKAQIAKVLDSFRILR